MIVAKKEIPSESCHWYDRDGNPVYEVPNKSKGGMRPTTLADARKLNLYPSVTTILGIVDKPALTAYKIDNAIMSALTLTRKPEESDADYKARILADSIERDVRRRENGTAIHKSIELGLQGKLFDTEHKTHFENVVAELKRYGFWNDFADVEKSFACDLGYGGKVDYHSKADGFVIDFKTTDKDLKDVRLWDNHYMQLAAYCRGLGMEIKKCKAGICYVHELTGEAKLLIAETNKLEKGLEMFLHLKNYWEALKDYKPKT